MEQAEIQRRVRIGIIIFVVFLAASIALPFTLKWYAGWIEISASSDSAEILVVRDSGEFEKIGTGSARFSEENREYSFVIREGGSETIITVESRRFETVKRSATLVPVVSPTTELPINAQYLFDAGQQGLLHVDADESSLLRSVDRGVIPGQAFSGITSARSVFWIDARNAVILDRLDQLIAVVDGARVKMFIPERERGNDGLINVELPSVSVNSRGQVAVLFGERLYVYDSPVDTSPELIASDLQASGLVALSDRGAIAYSNFPELGADEIVENALVGQEAILRIYNSSNGEVVSDRTLTDFDADAPLELAWSPDGARLLVASIFGLSMYEGNLETKVPLALGLSGIITSVTWIDDSTFLFGNDNNIWRGNASSLELQKISLSSLQVEPLGGITVNGNTVHFSGRDTSLLSTGAVQKFILP